MYSCPQLVTRFIHYLLLSNNFVAQSLLVSNDEQLTVSPSLWFRNLGVLDLGDPGGGTLIWWPSVVP